MLSCPIPASRWPALQLLAEIAGLWIVAAVLSPAPVRREAARAIPVASPTEPAATSGLEPSADVAEQEVTVVASARGVAGAAVAEGAARVRVGTEGLGARV